MRKRTARLCSKKQSNDLNRSNGKKSQEKHAFWSPVHLKYSTAYTQKKLPTRYKQVVMTSPRRQTGPNVLHKTRNHGLGLSTLAVGIPRVISAGMKTEIRAGVKGAGNRGIQVHYQGTVSRNLVMHSTGFIPPAFHAMLESFPKLSPPPYCNPGKLLR